MTLVAPTRPIAGGPDRRCGPTPSGPLASLIRSPLFHPSSRRQLFPWFRIFPLHPLNLVPCFPSLFRDSPTISLITPLAIRASEKRSVLVLHWVCSSPLPLLLLLLCPSYTSVCLLGADTASPLIFYACGLQLVPAFRSFNPQVQPRVDTLNRPRNARGPSGESGSGVAGRRPGSPLTPGTCGRLRLVS